MIHHQPPRLTPQQEHEAHNYRMQDLSGYIGRCLDQCDRDAAKREARHLLRQTIAKSWEEGDARVAKAAAFVDALIDTVAREWSRVLTDCRDAYVMLLMQDRLLRYVSMFGGPKVRRIRDQVRREMLAKSN